MPAAGWVLTIVVAPVFAAAVLRDRSAAFPAPALLRLAQTLWSAATFAAGTRLSPDGRYLAYMGQDLTTGQTQA